PLVMGAAPQKLRQDGQTGLLLAHVARLCVTERTGPCFLLLRLAHLSHLGSPAPRGPTKEPGACKAPGRTAVPRLALESQPVVLRPAFAWCIAVRCEL